MKLGNKTIGTLCVFAVAILAVSFIWLANILAPERRMVNCSLAEISPDFTPEVRQLCRERMRHKL